ncbi:hypothetical protein [Nocardia vinacea]|uniref:hypothetical protein n=1 Tax=Nocardia vinacea TaxID=96468 RepID=UPI0012F66D64|nr:hypothetical protein [Nocardia vinacea]
MMRARTSGSTHIRISNRRLAIVVPVLGVLLIAAMIVATGFGAETLPIAGQRPPRKPSGRARTNRE